MVFVIDRSGSMAKIATDMIGGFNRFIKDQKAVDGDCTVYAYQFDDEYDAIHDGIDIQDVPDLTSETYVPRNCTALYCSLGKTIADIGRKISEIDESERPEKVLFVTITDGLDNSSLYNSEASYDCQQVRDMIKHQTNKYDWSFAYLGANQDSWAVGGSMGVAKGSTLNYVASSKGVQDMYATLSDATTTYRSCAAKKFSFAKEETEEKES